MTSDNDLTDANLARGVDEAEVPGLNSDGPAPDRSPGSEGSDKLRRRWWVVAVCSVVVLVFGSVWAGSVLVRAYRDASILWDAGVEQSSSPSPVLSQQEAVEFVRAHEDNVIAATKKFLHSYEEYGFLWVESVEVIPDSVYEGVVDNPMMKASGLVYFDFYINGNRDYRVRKDSMIGPYYRGNLPETIGDPWVPGKMYGEGAGLSEKFNRIADGWARKIYPYLNELYPTTPVKEK